MNVTIKITNDRLHVSSPYNPDFPGPAKKLGGRWNGEAKSWEFDPRDEQRVRALCQDIYGTDGAVASGDIVTVRATFIDDVSELRGGIFVGGRQLARAVGRDSGAFLAEGVVILAGSGFRSGGSVKNWRTCVSAGTVFELRDIPRAKLPEIQSDARLENVEIIESDNRAALSAEREKLVARLAEINEILGN